MEIRKATPEDLETIIKMYDNGRKFMRDHGNAAQWVNGYPQKELLEEDIRVGQLYVVTEPSETAAEAAAPQQIIGAFAYILTGEPTYNRIDNGAWLNDEPYGTIHRLVSSGKHGGIANKIFDWALEQCPNLRGDTHTDNHVMQSVAEDYGFKMCGIIYLENGDPRLAYHVTRSTKK